MLHSDTMPPSITIKELHATTGEHVRRIGASRSPVIVTDRGQPVAVLANPSLLKPRRRHRTLLPEFAALMAQTPGNDLLDDLNAVRGEI
jgi:antitoxin (DNA-binding transcriptional repressor) of toxin-antitoxin stability system